MYLAAKFPAAKSRYGHFKLAPEATVERIRLGRQWNRGEPPKTSLPYDLIPLVLSQTGRGTLVAISQRFLPEEIKELFHLTGLSLLLQNYCRDVIFCSHLLVEGSPTTWGRGFVIDPSQPNSAYSLSLAEGQHIAADGYLSSAAQTAFVRGPNHPGDPTSAADVFRSLVFQLSYLAAESELLTKGVPVKYITAATKRYLAARREMWALYELSRLSQTRDSFQLKGEWLAEADSRLAAISGQLNIEESAIMDGLYGEGYLT